MNMNEYVATKTFFLGDIDSSIAAGTRVISDGYSMVQIAGITRPCPHIRNAIKAGLLAISGQQPQASNIHSHPQSSQDMVVRGMEVQKDAEYTISFNDKRIHSKPTKATGIELNDGKSRLTAGRFTNTTVIAEDQVQGEVIGSFSDRTARLAAQKKQISQRPSFEVASDEGVEVARFTPSGGPLIYENLNDDEANVPDLSSVISRSEAEAMSTRNRPQIKREFDTSGEVKVAATAPPTAPRSTPGCQDITNLLDARPGPSGTIEMSAAKHPTVFDQWHWQQKVKFIKTASLDALMQIPEQASVQVREAIKARRQELVQAGKG